MKKIIQLIIVIGFTITTHAQERIISGVVSDEMGPVADITVKIKGATKGTVTDFDGKYSIKAKTEDVLEFFCDNYKTILKEVKDLTNINLRMIKIDPLKEVSISTSCIKGQLNLEKNINNQPNKTQNQHIKALKNIPKMGIAKKPLFIIDGKVMSKSPKFKEKEIKSFHALNKKDCIALCGNSSRIVIVITTKKGLSKNRKTARPLYIVDGEKVSYKKHVKKLYRLKSSHRIKNKEMVKLYGKKAKNGVIFITTHKNKQK